MKRTNDFKTRPMMVVPTVQAKPQTSPELAAPVAPALVANIWQNASKQTVAVVALAIGVFVGLVVLGWWLWPVEWTGGTYQHLTTADKALLVEIASDLNAYDQNSAAVQELRQKWPELDALACFVASQPMVEETEKMRLMSLAYKVNPQGCQ